SIIGIPGSNPYGIFTHNCRCAMIPETPTWEQLGIPGMTERDRTIEPGPARFQRAAESTQRAVLGRSGYAAYQRGEVRLVDFVGQKQSDQWGSMRFQRSLADAKSAQTSAINNPGTPSTFMAGRRLL
ncbi:MAG: hypothetical protein ACRD2L_23525, partial [Terriglobia bacterium]